MPESRKPKCLPPESPKLPRGATDHSASPGGIQAENDAIRAKVDRINVITGPSAAMEGEPPLPLGSAGSVQPYARQSTPQELTTKEPRAKVWHSPEPRVGA